MTSKKNSLVGEEQIDYDCTKAIFDDETFLNEEGDV